MLKEGESLSNEQIPTPERDSTNALDYSFSGWDQDLSVITRSITVRPYYEAFLRDYTVKYYDEKGNLIETRIRSYGSVIEQDVKAPEKKSSFFFSYTFVRWGEKGQLVTGDTDVKPVYSKKLTGVGVATIIFAIILVGVGISVVYIGGKNKKRTKRRINPD